MSASFHLAFRCWCGNKTLVLHVEHACGLCSADNTDTVLAEIFLFPLQDKIALIKAEEFEIPLPAMQLLYYLKGI